MSCPKGYKEVEWRVHLYCCNTLLIWSATEVGNFALYISKGAGCSLCSNNAATKLIIPHLVMLHIRYISIGFTMVQMQIPCCAYNLDTPCCPCSYLWAR